MAEIESISSSTIKVYPSTRRNDGIDRYAKILTEANTILTNNNITTKKSYVVSYENSAGLLSIGTEDGKLHVSRGKYVLGGYTFTLSQDLLIDVPTATSSNVYLGIVVTNERLDGADVGTSNAVYNGLQLTTNSADLAGYTYSLQLGTVTRTSTGPEITIASDVFAKFNGGSTYITYDPAKNTGLGYNSTIDLQSFIDNLIIDDGTF